MLNRLFILLIGIAFTGCSEQVELGDTIGKHRVQQCQVVVVSKEYDKEDSDKKQLFLKDKGSINMDYIANGVFEYINIGDTILKENGEFSIHINRVGLDTTLYISSYSNQY